jgi:hypothetical protein
MELLILGAVKFAKVVGFGPEFTTRYTPAFK